MKKVLGLLTAITMMMGVWALPAAAHGHDNPCAMQHKMNPCNPCAMKHHKMNPCAMKHKMNPCNPCAMKHKMNPCNPCAMKGHM